VVLTGDFGLYNVKMPDLKNKNGIIEDDRRCIRDPEEGPCPAVPFDEAVRFGGSGISRIADQKGLSGKLKEAKVLSTKVFPIRLKLGCDSILLWRRLDCGDTESSESVRVIEQWLVIL
jgi:hypothetical protein